MARCKGDFFIADADTVIMSVNKHIVNIPVKHGDTVDLRGLRAQYPEAKPAPRDEEAAEVDFDEPVNLNVRGGVAVAEPVFKEVLRAVDAAPIHTTVPPDGWVKLEAYGIVWTENPKTHKPLGASNTQVVKTMTKKSHGGGEFK